MIKIIKRILRSPIVSFLYLASGIVIAALWSNLKQDYFHIVGGTEICLFAIVRFLFFRQIKYFFTSLIVLGIALPLTAGLTSPLFYGGTLVPEYFFKTLGLGLIPGIALILIGWKGIHNVTYSNYQNGTKTKCLTFEPYLSWLEYLCEFSIWILISTVMSGEWSSWGIFVVSTSGIILFLTIVVFIFEKTSIGLEGIGKGIIFSGLITIIVSIAIVIVQGRHCVEALLGIPPGILLVIIGVIVMRQSVCVVNNK